MKETEVGKRKRGARRQGKESSGGEEEEGENEMRGGKGGKRRIEKERSGWDGRGRKRIEADGKRDE